MRYLLLIFPVLISVFTTGVAFADCGIDKDWPDKPCLDMPPYSKTTLTQTWDEYHSLKGQEWMEDKKSEMDYAIEKGILDEWLSYGTQSRTYQNHNVHFYYFLHDAAPATESYHESLIKVEDRNRDVMQYSSSEKDPYEVIITYYYISTGGLLLLSPMVIGSGTIGFLVWRKRR